CQFTYEGTTYQVALGFEVTSHSLKTYDKGLDPGTGKGIWGALLGPYQYEKKQDFSAELEV
ncbi:MAG: CpcT/CpeT family chromophore lyase, partial [Microcystis sp. M53601_WE4]|nr:CpcT/CpeT family chromophore lyase [Microcystis sp. M53601_WE4]